VKVEQQAEEEAKKHGIEVFSGNVIYKLVENHKAWITKLREGRKQEKLASIAWPAKFRFMHGCVFRNSKPAIIGARVLEGKLRRGITVIGKNGRQIGKLSSIEVNNEKIEEAMRGQEVAVSIDKGIVGRNLHENEEYYSAVPKKDFAVLETIKGSFNSDELELLGEIKEIQSKIRWAKE
jgi:translation initiation factor 5B